MSSIIPKVCRLQNLNPNLPAKIDRRKPKTGICDKNIELFIFFALVKLCTVYH